MKDEKVNLKNAPKFTGRRITTCKPLGNFTGRRGEKMPQNIREDGLLPVKHWQGLREDGERRKSLKKRGKTYGKTDYYL